MIDVIYDEEIYPNVFTMAVKQAHVDAWWEFEISNRVNDLDRLCEFIAWLQSINGRMIGFNNHGFDYPVLHYILTCSPSNLEIYNFSQAVLHASDDEKYKYLIWDDQQIVQQLDLFKIHHFDNKAKMTGLKMLEFNMRMNSVEDLPFEPGRVLTSDEIDTLRSYGRYDVVATEKFYIESKNLITFREELTEKYNRNFLNHNDTKIGKDYFIMELERTNPGACYYKDANGKRQKRQTWRHSIALNDVIFPYISFNHPGFTAVLDWLKNKTIQQTKGVFTKIPVVELGNLVNFSELTTNRRTKQQTVKNLHTVVNGFRFDFGTGGIHGSIDGQTVRSDDTHDLIDIDVASYYPNLAIANRLYPEHLGEQFCAIYLDVYNQRKTYAKGSAENAMLKLALNGVYGDSNNRFSPFYDPAYTMAITINGQLLLCMLAEHLMAISGLQMIQINTDGVTVRLPKTKRSELESVCSWWEKFTCLELEFADYSAMFIRDVNNYLAVYDDGKIKRKGAFAWKFDTVAGLNKGVGDLDWHQNHSALIIPMAAEMALVHGIDPAALIKHHTCEFDFMLRAKIPRSSRLVLFDDGNETQLPNMTRYYIARRGGSLVKIMPPLERAPDQERRIGIDVGWRAAECNNMAAFDRANLNFDYYIQGAEKLIDSVRKV
jgi:hypothetical protein